MGWTKGLELAKVARRDGKRVRLCNLVAQGPLATQRRIQARSRNELTGEESEPWEIIYFKVYKSQIPVLEQAIDTAALMLGTDKSRGYCLEMICADFLAGAHLEAGNGEVLLQAISRLFNFLSERAAATVSRNRLSAGFMSKSFTSFPKAAPIRLGQDASAELREINPAARRLALPALRLHAKSRGPSPAVSQPRRGAHRRQSDYTLRGLPSENPRTKAARLAPGLGRVMQKSDASL